jgi:hypothetical protein
VFRGRGVAFEIERVVGGEDSWEQARSVKKKKERKKRGFNCVVGFKLLIKKSLHGTFGVESVKLGLLLGLRFGAVQSFLTV